MMSQVRNIVVCATLLFIGGGAATTSASGQEPPTNRTLAGHTFIASSVLEDPFITTHIRTMTGAAIAKGVIADLTIQIGDSVVSILEGDLAFMALSFEYQHRVADWLALGGGFQGGARLGTGAESVLAQGVTSIFAVQLRARARVFERERWLLSLNLRLQPTTQYALDPIGFVNQAIEDGGLSEGNSLIRSSTTNGGAVGIRGAYVPAPWIGFQLLFDVGYANAFSDEGRGKLKTLFGGLVSWDLMPAKDVPIGFLATFKSDRFVEANSDIADRATTVGWGISYTGREDLSIGLEASRVKIPQFASGRSVNAATVAFNLRYYF